MSNIYSEARKEYIRLKEKFLTGTLHENHLEGLIARKKYFKDNTYEIHVPGENERKEDKGRTTLNDDGGF